MPLFCLFALTGRFRTLIHLFNLTLNKHAISVAFEGDSCSKNADCGQNEVCSFYDEQFPPWMWPPCPHYGKCACVDGTVNVNSRCLACKLMNKMVIKLTQFNFLLDINLNLYDQCTNARNERYQTPEQICDGRQVVCNRPTYIVRFFTTTN